MAKQIIRITESDIRGIIRECIRNYHGSLLTEDRESKNMKKARNVVRRFQPNADAMQIITAIRNDIPNSRINQCEYLPGVTRMYMNNEINNAETISKLNATLKLLGTAHANEYNNDLNGMNADELINRFSTAVQSIEISVPSVSRSSTQAVSILNSQDRIFIMLASLTFWYFSLPVHLPPE